MENERLMHPRRPPVVFLSLSDAGLSGWKGIALAVLAIFLSKVRPIKFGTDYRGGWLWAHPHPHDFNFGRWQQSLNRTLMGLKTLRAAKTYKFACLCAQATADSVCSVQYARRAACRSSILISQNCGVSPSTNIFCHAE